MRRVTVRATVRLGRWVSLPGELRQRDVEQGLRAAPERLHLGQGAGQRQGLHLGAQVRRQVAIEVPRAVVEPIRAVPDPQQLDQRAVGVVLVGHGRLGDEPAAHGPGDQRLEQREPRAQDGQALVDPRLQGDPVQGNGCQDPDAVEQHEGGAVALHLEEAFAAFGDLDDQVDEVRRVGVAQGEELLGVAVPGRIRQAPAVHDR